MKTLHFCFIISTIIPSVFTVICIECLQTHFTGDPRFDDCYNLKTLSIRENTNCEINDSDAYCYTKVELSDGLVSHLERGCTTPESDVLYASNEAPDSIKCTSSYRNGKDSQDIHQTQCYMSCKEDVCNDNEILDKLISCPGGCPENSDCNYLTGKCQCEHNLHGKNCSFRDVHPDSSHSCVQCNSRIQPDCEFMTVGTECQNGERYCSSSKTWILKQDGSADGDPITTKSCTSQYLSPDRCYLTDTSDHLRSAQYTEYTCVATCSEDNCNTGTANGNIDEEFIPMKCVVCEGDESSCGPSKTLATACPRNTTHCVSTVTYWETIIHDSNLKGLSRPEPSVSIRSIKRGCASEPVNERCKKSRVGALNMHEVSCTESCSEDGCNTGWPARPKCVLCDNAGNVSKGKVCLNSPPRSQDCPSPHHEFCFTQLRNERSVYADYGEDKFSIIRGCSRFDDNLESECRNITEYGRVMGVDCIRYCRDNGCNYRRFYTPDTTTVMPETRLGFLSGATPLTLHQMLRTCLFILVMRSFAPH